MSTLPDGRLFHASTPPGLTILAAYDFDAVKSQPTSAFTFSGSPCWIDRMR